jgi:charged multivesicular body protein 1
MSKFESQLESLDVQTGTMDDVMNRQAALSTPEHEVNTLMHQIALDHGLDITLGMPQASSAQVAQPAAAKEDDFDAMLANLRGK